MGRSPNTERLAGKAFALANPGLTWPATIDHCPHPMCGQNNTPDGTRRDWLDGALTQREKQKARA